LRKKRNKKPLPVHFMEVLLASLKEKNIYPETLLHDNKKLNKNFSERQFIAR